MLSGKVVVEKQAATCREQWLAATLQSKVEENLGIGLEHQLPHLYSQSGSIVFVQRAADVEVVIVVAWTDVGVDAAGVVVGATDVVVAATYVDVDVDVGVDVEVDVVLD
jgi:hypothetical protein